MTEGGFRIICLCNNISSTTLLYTYTSS